MRLISLILLYLLVTVATGSADEWLSLTSFREIRHLQVFDDTLYATTSGGLLAVNRFDEPGRQFVGSDGLGTTNLTDIIMDDIGQRWITGFGRLIRFDPEMPEQFLFLPVGSDLFQLNRLVDDDDDLWVATDSGLVRFSKVNDGGQIENHLQLTVVNPFPAVFDLAIIGDSIWLATEIGLLTADITASDLTPARWTRFDLGQFPVVGNDTARRVVSFAGELYIGSPTGLFRLDCTVDDTSFAKIPLAWNRRVLDLVVEGDTLFVYYLTGLGVLTEDGVATLPIDGLPGAPATGISYDGVRWVADHSGGLYANYNGIYEEYEYTGPPANDASVVAIDGRGRLVTGYGWDGFARLDGSTWEKLDIPGGAMRLFTDATGDVWAGTWGKGMWHLSGDSLVRYDESNSTLRGIPDDPQYVVVRGIAGDDSHIYACCYLAENNSPVAAGQLDCLDDLLAWDSAGIEQGLTDVRVSSLSYGDGDLVVGTDGVGLFVCDAEAALSGTSDVCIRYARENSPLPSNTIRVTQHSPFGNLWVGTNFGLSRWDPGIERFVNVDLPLVGGPDVKALEFDGRGNLWIGTSTGLARLDAPSFIATAYTTNNSDLLADDVRDLALNRETGELYVATTGGISVLVPQVRHLTTVIDSVVPIPNPFIIRSGADRLHFNYDQPGVIRIYTVVGEPVIDLLINQTWDGRNEAGRDVASGVYLYVLTGANGDIARGKLLLVRDR